MKNNHRLFDLAGSWLITTLLSGSLTMVAIATLGLQAAPIPLFLLSAGIALTLSLMVYSKGTAVAAWLMLAAGLVGLHFAGVRPVNAIRDLVLGLFNESGEMMITDYAMTLSVAIAVVLTPVLFWVSRMSGGVYPALTITLILFLCAWFIERRFDAVYAVLSLVSLICLYVRASDDQVNYLRALPVAVLIALLAFFATPLNEPTYPPLKDAADRVRQLFDDYFMFTDARTAYSLHNDGYLPLGDRLGGPANPRDEAVMRVRSQVPVYLRGAVKRTYTGYSWIDNVINNRYLFGDITKRTVRNAVFDTGRLDALNASDWFSNRQVDITMLAPATSTLFLPHRTIDLNTAIDLVAYFNNSGEVFATRSLTGGDSYSLLAELTARDASTMGPLIDAAATLDDPQYEDILSSYLTLPRNMEEGVYELTRSVIEGAQTPYEVAMRIQQHLLTQYEYSMDVNYPDTSRDFVSQFLLTDKKGYCTYFATAMSVMGRIAGLPTRYIEGYAAMPDSNGEVLVTGQNAHAWTEIYFSGIGWITFNATPGFGDMRDGDSGGGGGAPPDANPEGQDDPMDEHEGEGEDPVEEQPTPPPPENDDSSNDDNPEEDEPEEEEPPEEPEEEDPPPEEEAPPEDEEQPPKRIYPFILLALALMLLSLAIFYRIRKTDPRYLAGDYKKSDEKLIVWYRALLVLLQQQGQVPEASESPMQFAKRLKEAGIADDNFITLSEQLTVNRYAKDQKLAAGTLKAAGRAYDNLKHALKAPERVRWILHRVLYGLGDMHRLP